MSEQRAWLSDVNGVGEETLLKESAFNDKLNANIPSKGSFNEDYESFALEFGVTRCHLVKGFTIDNGESENEKKPEMCRVTNALIDISSWRCMLLALSTVGSKVIELDIHSCKLSSQHLNDMRAALERLATCKILRMQYIVNSDTSDEGFSDVCKTLLSDTLNVEYFSFVGSSLSDDFLNNMTPAISGNYRLKALNLSKNNFSDEAVKNFFIALRHNNNLQEISFQKCGLNGSFLSNSCGSLMSGKFEATADDGKVAKDLAKIIGEKNKAIKALNGKRKKAGFQTDIAEIDATPSFVTGNTITNRSISTIDISYNPLEEVEVDNFISKIAESQDIETEGLPQVTIIGRKTITLSAETQAKIKNLLMWVPS